MDQMNQSHSMDMISLEDPGEVSMSKNTLA